MSEPLKLSKHDLIRIARGAMFATGGAILVFAGVYLQTKQLDWNLFLAAIGSILINTGHKFFTDTRADQQLSVQTKPE